MTAEPTFPLTTRQPGEIIAQTAAGPVRLEQFLDHVQRLADALPDAHYVINLAPDRYRYLLGFCAAVLRGQCTLMPPNRQPDTLSQTAARYGDCYTFGGADRIDNIAHFDAQAVPLAHTGTRSSIPDIPGGQVCCVVFTSGSTGDAVANTKFWHTLRSGTLSNIQLMLGGASAPGSPTPSIVATVPPQHMWGFETSILLPLWYNAAICERMPFFPAEISAAVAALPQPRILVSSPVHLRALQRGTTERPAIDKIFTATAPISPSLARDLHAEFAASVTDVFGCSESGIIAARNALDEDDWTLADAFELSGGKDGTLINAPHLAKPVPLPDIVELLGDRRFRWLGRSQDMINIAGKRGSLAELNRRLLRVPGVHDAAIFLPDDNAQRLAALVVTDDLQPSDIIAALRAAVEPVFLPRPVYRVDRLPRAETGKLPRKALLEMFETLRRERAQHEA